MKTENGSEKENEVRVDIAALIALGFSIAVFLFVFFTVAVMPFFNNLGSTESRADVAGNLFIKQNDIQVARLACAGDFNGDGFGTCNIMTLDKEDIYLKCPTDFVDVKIFGAKKCREIFTNLDIGFHTIK